VLEEIVVGVDRRETPSVVLPRRDNLDIASPSEHEARRALNSAIDGLDQCAIGADGRNDDRVCGWYLFVGCHAVQGRWRAGLGGDAEKRGCRLTPPSTVTGSAIYALDNGAEQIRIAVHPTRHEWCH